MVMLRDALYTKPREDSGIQRATGEEIQRVTNLEPVDINEAVKALDNEGNVKAGWIWRHDRFTFSVVYLQPLGRLAYEEKLEEITKLIQERKSRERQLV